MAPKIQQVCARKKVKKVVTEGIAHAHVLQQHDHHYHGPSGQRGCCASAGAQGFKGLWKVHAVRCSIPLRKTLARSLSNSV